MDNKAFYNLSYGVFVLGTNAGGRLNACITNTCMQVANDPTRIAISCINKNKTCEMIKQSETFALSVLDKDATFDTIKHFGYQSGHNVEKFENLPFLLDDFGNPYLKNQVCSVFSCKVLSATDLETHTLFVAKVMDAQVLSSKKPITYADYQADIKPKSPVQTAPVQTDKKIIGWRCKICGYEYYDSTSLPEDFACPICGHPKEDFEPIYEK